jgi:DNA-binding FrmR family transcriptional regulator
MPARGYAATKDQLLARLARIEGQIRGIEGTVAEDRYCIDVLTQEAVGRLMRRG